MNVSDKAEMTFISRGGNVVCLLLMSTLYKVDVEDSFLNTYVVLVLPLPLCF